MCATQLHISVAHLSGILNFGLSLSPLTRTSRLHMLHIIFACPLHLRTLRMHFSFLLLDFQAKRCQAGALVRSCAQRSCEPEARCMLCGSSVFCLQQLGCSTFGLRMRGLLCLSCVSLNSASKPWLNRGVAAARSAAVSPRLAVTFLLGPFS